MKNPARGSAVHAMLCNVHAMLCSVHAILCICYAVHAKLCMLCCECYAVHAIYAGTSFQYITVI